jgi:uncharacterized protein YbdZ (MbtH family)
MSTRVVNDNSVDEKQNKAYCSQSIEASWLDITPKHLLMHVVL